MTDHPLVAEAARLAEIKATLRYWDTMYAQHPLNPLPPAAVAQESARHLNRAQIDFLVENTDLAFELGDLNVEKQLTIDRLRGLLGRLEWAGTTCYEDYGTEKSCPACGAVLDVAPDFEGHTPDCWLAKELGRQ